ncbi:DHA2 family efflux MFS transporter permease subunit [Streptomyces sp. NPDC048172]|uniref:DHA2 family efflux MFS transporter permease subunit n=1 Tax=Streptomyces sp. NPDC048172 TaxID=3365505 RepID=UPI0037175105
MPHSTGEAGADAAPDGKLSKEIWVLAGVLTLGSIMAVLDTTIVNVALNTLSSDLDTDLNTVQWTVTGYFLAMGTVIPLVGWAVDRFGAKRLWLLSLLLFVLGSALSGMAWSIEALIGFRVLQGLGGGMILPLVQTILATAAGPQRMGRVMGLVMIPTLLGPVLGPVLGGWLVEDVDWRWIFFVNIPVGILAIFFAAWKLPRGEGRSEPARALDVRGLMLLPLGLVSLLYGFSRAGTEGFGDGPVLGFLLVGAVLTTAFVLSAVQRGERALVDVRLFRDRTFAASTTTIFLFSIGLYGVMLLLPLYYQVVRGEGALHAGLLLAPQGVGAMLAMPLAAILTDRIGPGRIVLTGAMLALAGTYVFTQVADDTSYTLLTLALVVRGFGLASTMAPTFTAAYATLSPASVPKASSTISSMQQLGGSVGSAVLSLTLSNRIEANMPDTPGGGSPTGEVGEIPPEVRERAGDFLATAFGQTFWVAFWLIVAILVPASLLPRKPLNKNAPPPPPAEHRTGKPATRS